MTKSFAIARVTLRNAIRSKVVISLMLILLIISVGVPLTIKGDGTAGGFVQVLISYTLGMSTFVLALATLWAGSAAVAAEISDKTAHMVVAKPVSMWQLWLGKWLGLNIMNAGLLLFCGMITYGLLLWKTSESQMAQPGQREEAQRALSARRVILPEQPDYELRARKELDQLLQQKGLPEGISENDALQSIVQRKKTESNMVRAGERIRWSVRNIPPAQIGKTAYLHYRFSSSLISLSPVAGTWTIHAGDTTNKISMSVTNTPRSHCELAFSMPALSTGLLEIEFRNEDPAGSTIIFDIHQGIAVLIPEGTFASNYLRGLLVLYGRLSLLAAIGVTAGCIFSLPVAAFLSLFILLLTYMGGYIEQVAQRGIKMADHAHGPTASEDAVKRALNTMVNLTYKSTALVIRPLLPEDPLARLSSGRLIDYRQTVRGFFWQGIVYSALIGSLAAIALRRRELALPST